MARLRINNKQWQRIQPMIPDGKPGGRPILERRTILDGILWILRTGAPWRDLPEEFGKWQTVWRLFDQWNGDGSRSVPWPVRLTGDKGYRADWIDTCLIDLGILPVIPSKSNEDRDSRPVPFDGDSYRKRNIIERIIGWIKENRRVFSRFEKTAKNFGGMIKMAFIRCYLKSI